MSDRVWLWVFAGRSHQQEGQGCSGCASVTEVSCNGMSRSPRTCLHTAGMPCFAGRELCQLKHVQHAMCTSWYELVLQLQSRLSASFCSSMGTYIVSLAQWPRSDVLHSHAHALINTLLVLAGLAGGECRHAQGQHAPEDNVRLGQTRPALRGRVAGQIASRSPLHGAQHSQGASAHAAG